MSWSPLALVCLERGAKASGAPRNCSAAASLKPPHPCLRCKVWGRASPNCKRRQLTVSTVPCYAPTMSRLLVDAHQPARGSRRSGPAPQYTRADIVRVALDKHPTDLSMRAIAKSLGLSPTALYRYFPSREDLLYAVAEEVSDALILPPPNDDWRQWLTELAVRWRQLALDYPCILDPALGTTMESAGFRIVQAVDDVLAAHGFDLDATVDIYYLLSKFTSGAAREPLSGAQRDTRELQGRIAALGVSERLEAFAYRAVTVDAREQFHRHVTWMLKGIPDPTRDGQGRT
jgi:AcrR family transcriptional regulator